MFMSFRSADKTCLINRAVRSTLEGLEPRQMLAANDPLTVTVFKSGKDSWLNVVGTATDDAIVVQENSATSFTVSNGSWTVTKTGKYVGFRVLAGAGDDSVSLAGTLACRISVLGEAGNDTLTGGAAADVLNGGIGDDSLDGGAGNDVLVGDVGDDTLVGGLGNDNLNGNAGNDSLSGGDGDDILVGLDGNDSLHGDAGNDSMNGGVGDDQLAGGIGNDTLVGDLGNDTLAGEAGNDSINGGVGNDNVDGGDGDDHLVAGGTGSDFYVGGAGLDVLDYTGRVLPLTITLDGQANDGAAGETGSVADDIETVIGGNAGDTITGNANANIFYGGAGADSIDGGAGNDTIYGGAGMDSLTGGDGDDCLRGDADADQLFGNAGDDLLEGGAGNDQLDGGAGDDHLIAIGGGVADSLTGGDGFDSFWLDFDATDRVVDASDSETAAAAIHRVKGFVSYGKTVISKEITGQKLAEPTGTGKVINFAGHELFADAGPAEDDIAQGATGDCWYLSSLASIAKVAPEVLQQSITALGDGTYAARFFNPTTHAEQYVRVDADLYTYTWSATTPMYADFGAGGSLWAPLLEKALTWVRGSKLGTYKTIEAGWMSEAYNRLGMTSSETWKDPRYNHGLAVLSNASAMIDWINTQVTAGKVVGAGFNAITGGVNLLANHAYTVDHTVDNGDGTFSVVLRNPWGVDGNHCTDGTNDGYVTVTAAQLFANYTALMSGAAA